MGRPFQWKYRHTVLSILFLASIVSFMDRVAMPVAIPYIAAEYHLSSFESGLLMGVASGLINMGGQMAAFISPIFIGYLVGAAEEKYGHAFIFLIASLLVSCAIVLTLSGKSPRHQDEAIYGCSPSGQ